MMKYFLMDLSEGAKECIIVRSNDLYPCFYHFSSSSSYASSLRGALDTVTSTLMTQINCVHSYLHEPLCFGILYHQALIVRKIPVHEY
jgi:hypothetical protein